MHQQYFLLPEEDSRGIVDMYTNNNHNKHSQSLEETTSMLHGAETYKNTK